MRRVEGSAGVSLMECTNPVKDKWRIRWDVQEKENGSASYMEEEFNHKPTGEEIRTLVMSWYNRQTQLSCPDSPIMVPLYGFLWRISTIIRQHTIWLFRRAEKPYRSHSSLVRMNIPNTILLVG